MTYYCIYCAHYGFSFQSDDPDEVVRHADEHPIGDPEDMVVLSDV